jgi:hypothetical protein
MEWYELMGLMSIECEYCNVVSKLCDFHHSIKTGVVTIHGIRKPDHYILECPHCKEKIKLVSYIRIM